MKFEQLLRDLEMEAKTTRDPAFRAGAEAVLRRIEINKGTVTSAPVYKSLREMEEDARKRYG